MLTKYRKEADMKQEHRFLISYIHNNQPESINITADSSTLSSEDALRHMESLGITRDKVSDLQIMGMHHPLRLEVRPGHYQQPEGNE
jgi:hypothetical protein